MNTTVTRTSAEIVAYTEAERFESGVMTATIEIATASPAEIDAEIARIGSLISGQYAIVERNEQVLASSHASEARRVAARERIEECAPVLRNLNDELAPFSAEFTARGGWTRYYLVEGGHLHFDCTWGRCSRVPSTRHYFFTELSGRPAAEVIELAGDRVCTVCFPDAPVAAQNRPSQLLTKDEETKAAERAEREQKAAEKAAKAKANAIFDPETGKALSVPTGGRYRETFKTERAAWIHLVDQMWDQRFYGLTEERTAVITTITKAIAAKHGQEVGEIRSQAIKKLEARIRREG